MADFKTTLEALARGDVAFEKVAKTVDTLLTRNPQVATDVLDQLSEAYSDGVIDAQTYVRLKQSIARHTDQFDPTAHIGDEKPRFEDDQATQIFDTPGPESAIAANTVDFDLRGDSHPSTDSSWPSGPTTGSQNGAASAAWGRHGETTGELKIEPGSVLKGRFKLDNVLGIGGMGTVYKGRDLIKVEARDRNPYVAFKVLNEDFKKHPDSFIALQREASRQQKLAHPNIATVYDFDRTEGGTVFLTMELLEGQALNEFIKKKVRPQGGLPFDEAFPIIEGLGHALVYAHDRSIVHSDFKPGNCFITKDGTMKVLDFGIARAVKNPGQGDGDKTLFDPAKLGALTPAYASLEMLEGEEPDPRDDLYALACVSYELLVGKHPFNKLPANTARDHKLVPAPVKSITRKQNKGLMRGLAFERANRSQSVAEFLEELEGKTSPFKNPFIMVPAAIVVIALAGAVPTLNYLHDREINTRIELAQTGGPEGIAQVLEWARQSDEDVAPEDRDRVLGGARDQILAYYNERVSEHVDIDKGRYDFAGARAVIDEIEGYKAYQGLQKTTEFRRRLDQQEKTLLAVQMEIFNRAIETGALLRDDSREDVHDVLDVVSQFSPETVKGLNRRLPGAYAAAIDQALAGEKLDIAQALALSGVNTVENKNLRNLVDKVNGARERAELALAILQRTARIQAALAKSDRLTALLSAQEGIPVQEDIKALRDADPTNDLLGELAAKIGPLVKEDIDALNRSRDWGNSDLMAGDYSQGLKALGLHDLNVRTLKLRDEYQGEIGKIVARIAVAAAEHKLTPPARANAGSLLETLVAIAPDNQRTIEARDLVSRAYLREARLARAAGRFDDARAQIGAARAVEPTATLDSLIESELATINADGSLDSAALERAIAERRTSFDQAFTDLQQATASLTADASQVDHALAELDRLESLRPGEPSLEALRDKLAERIAQVTDELGETGGWDAALAVTRNAIAYAPGSQALTGKLEAIEARQREASIATQRRYVANRKQEVEALLAEATADRAWSTEIQQKTADIETLAEPDDEWIAQTRTKIAEVYVVKATAMRETERLAEGSNLLARAERYAPDLPALITERLALSAASEAFDREQREQERLARIDGLKQTFETQTNASDVANGAKTFEKLRAELPADDPFIEKKAPVMLGTAYYRLATRKAENNDFAEALNLAKAGLKLQPNSQKLRFAIKEYTVDGNEQELTRMFSRGEAFDVNAALEKIVEIQTLDPQAYGEGEDTWAKAVADRVQALQENGGESANLLIEQAQEVFAGNQFIAALKPAGPLVGAPAKYGPEIQRAIDGAMLTKAKDLLKKADSEEGRHPDIVRLKGAYNARIKEAKALYEDYKTTFRAKNYEQANNIIDQALGTWGDSGTFQREKARVLAALEPGGALRRETAMLPPPPSKNPCNGNLAGHGKRKKGTCYDMVAQRARGPLMVVVPASENFSKPFAIGKYEVAVSDFNNYCKLSGACEAIANREGRLPATGISLEQARGYAHWLSERTGNVYRLPTAEEWTYAASAGGQQPQKDYNCRVEQGGQVLKGQSLMGVNTGKANGWGLYNYVGNAQEWVTSGSGVTVRGGAFDDSFSKCSVSLEKPHDGHPDDSTGLRLLQELS